MKKICISIDDLLVVLDAMKDNGTTDIIFFEFNSLPAICDKNEPDNIITFQSVNETGEVDEDNEVVH